MADDILTEEELERAVKQVFKLSQTDPEFRALCLSKPNEAIHQVTGKVVPGGIKLQFLDSPAAAAANERGDAST
jgi:hypothetical protein